MQLKYPDLKVTNATAPVVRVAFWGFVILKTQVSRVQRSTTRRICPGAQLDKATSRLTRTSLRLTPRLTICTFDGCCQEEPKWKRRSPELVGRHRPGCYFNHILSRKSRRVRIRACGAGGGGARVGEGGPEETKGAAVATQIMSPPRSLVSCSE